MGCSSRRKGVGWLGSADASVVWEVLIWEVLEFGVITARPVKVELGELGLGLSRVVGEEN